MNTLFQMINGLWDAVNTTTIYTDGHITFTIGSILITFFIINVCIFFIRTIIKGKGDKADE